MWIEDVRGQFLHLSVYRCEQCEGPVARQCASTKYRKRPIYVRQERLFAHFRTKYSTAWLTSEACPPEGQCWAVFAAMRRLAPYGLELWLMSSAAASKKNRGFDPHTFLATIGEGRKMLSVPKKQTIFVQGDEADSVFYIQKGKVRLTVVSKAGREATIAILGEGNFFGEGSLAGQVRRMGSAACTDSL
jgi:cyclic nucleotide-binding protein